MKREPKCKVDGWGTKRWFLNGEYHREDGPAVENAVGNKYWFLHGYRHREDGPAVEWADGLKEWWLHHKPVDPEQIVDYHLMRGVFCYYNEETQTLHFAKTK